MSQILKIFVDTIQDGRPHLRLRQKHANSTPWLILDCGHWYHWTSAGADIPSVSTQIDCPSCNLPIVVHPAASEGAP